MFQLSSSQPPLFSIPLYLYLHSHMRLRPKSSLLKPTWPKSKYSQVDVLVNKWRGPRQTSKAHLYISRANKILFSSVYFYSPCSINMGLTLYFSFFFSSLLVGLASPCLCKSFPWTTFILFFCFCLLHFMLELDLSNRLDLIDHYSALNKAY